MFGTVHVPEFKHAGHNAPSVQAGFSSKRQPVVPVGSCATGFAQRPVPAPVNMFEYANKCTRLVALERDDGRVPLSLLLYRKSCCNLLRSRFGSVPLMVL